NAVDTVIIENSTIYNITARIFRDDGGQNNYMKLNQNTVVNSGMRILEFGEIIEGIVTNNIFVNCGYLAQDSSSGHGLFDMDSIGDGSTQSITISNNCFYTSSEVENAWPDADTVVPVGRYDETSQAFADAKGLDGTNIELQPDFTNPPPDPIQGIQAFWDANTERKLLG
ncbi:MAG: hypothetical protein HC906_08535, partial [Bacteroidales bacterium]|nr:hypothetical protein [Bacteroidales bacterium]